jgi:hypothetical protein
MSHHIGPNTELERGAAGGQPPSSIEETNPFPEQGSTECIILLWAPLYNIYFMYMIAHLRTGVGWNLVALGLLPLQRYLVYPTMV